MGVKIIAPFAALIVFIVYAIVMYEVPKKEYNKTKDKYETIGKPKKSFVSYHFILNIFLGLMIFILLLFVMTDGDGRALGECFIIILPFLAIFFIVEVVIYFVCLASGFKNIPKPSNVLLPIDIHNYINRTQSNNLMGYVYGSSIDGKNTYYSDPAVFKINLIDYQSNTFDEKELGNMFYVRLNTVDNKSDAINQLFRNATVAVQSFWENKNKQLEKIYMGVYPDFSDVYYVSKTGKFSGKYGKSSRAASIIFGLSTFYDHYVKSLPLIPINITRNIDNSESHVSFHISNYKVDQKPDLSLYYDNLYN